MKVGFEGHNYIVVFKHDNKCKIKPCKTAYKAEKYFYNAVYKCAKKSEWYIVTILDTMGKELKRIVY